MATYATLVTSKGDIRARLFEDTAPKTVENFIGLATGKKSWVHPRTREQHNDPLYAGTIFHRVIPDFMIQGGDPLGTGTGGPGYTFEDEVSGGPKFDAPGYLAMANAGPNTNGSQFFVTVAATPWLNGKHTIFGKVVEGQDVADAISKVPSSRDKPKIDVVLTEVRIEEADQ
jgi:peptidyl-prolyl cis-trans isomerase A (cyclophilin A)